MKSIRTTLIVLAAVGFLGTACNGVTEGDRCNPLLSHNECSSGLTCVQPATCVESYCCPTDPTTSSNPYCNGTGCPPPEAGAGDAGDDRGDGATSDAPASDSPSDAPSDGGTG